MVLYVRKENIALGIATSSIYSQELGTNNPPTNLLLPGQKEVLGLNLTTQGRATVDLLAKEKITILPGDPPVCVATGASF